MSSLTHSSNPFQVNIAKNKIKTGREKTSEKKRHHIFKLPSLCGNQLISTYCSCHCSHSTFVSLQLKFLSLSNEMKRTFFRFSRKSSILHHISPFASKKAVLRIRDVYPRSWFLPIPDLGSWIQKQQKREGWKKIFVIPFL